MAEQEEDLASWEHRMTTLFSALDEGKKGFLTREDLRAVLEKAAPRLAHSCGVMFAEADADKNGKVGLREFLALMRVARRHGLDK